MREAVSLTGMVLLAASFGEADRRVVLLTRERGKITAFAHGARRPGSALMAVTRPFVFGTFNVFEGRSAYTLQSAQPVCYFDELSAGPVTELIFWKWPPIWLRKTWTEPNF